MARNFPSNPQDGDIYEGYIYDGTRDLWNLQSDTFATEAYVDAGLLSKINDSEKGQANGVATLDNNTQIQLGFLDYVIDGAPGNLNTLGKIANMFRIQTTAEWALITDILPAGSINIETDGSGQKKVKIGKDSGTWADLEYVLETEELQIILDTVEMEHQAIYDAIALKASSYAPTFTGDVVLPQSTTIGSVTYTDLTNIYGLTDTVANLLAAKLSITDAALEYAPINSPTFSGTVSLPESTSIGSVSNLEIASLDGISTSETIQTQINNLETEKAPTNNPVFTGVVYGITADMVGLGNVDNTADADKPITTPVQDALDLKANLSGATFSGDIEAPNLTISGDLYVAGTTTTVSSKSYTTRDNMIYMNQAGAYEITDASGDGTTVTYTAPGHDYEAGDSITISGIDPSGYNISGADALTIDTVSPNTFTVLKTATGTYVSGGTARGKSNANPDLGWAAGRYSNGYAHTGMFRDATDGKFKLFDGYIPEPDTSVFIDTAHESFALAPIEVSTVTFGDGSIQTKAGVPSQTSFVYKTESYTLDSLSLADNIIEVSSSSATTITIPLDSSINYPVGTSMDILQTGSGQVTIAATGGVTLNGTPGFKLRTQWSSATILKRAANTWIVYGDLSA